MIKSLVFDIVSLKRFTAAIPAPSAIKIKTIATAGFLRAFDGMLDADPCPYWLYAGGVRSCKVYTTPQSGLASKIRFIMFKCDITGREWCRRAGISHDALGHYLSGNYKLMPARLIQRLTCALNLEYGELAEFESPGGNITMPLERAMCFLPSGASQIVT